MKDEQDIKRIFSAIKDDLIMVKRRLTEYGIAECGIDIDSEKVILLFSESGLNYIVSYCSPVEEKLNVNISTPSPNFIN